MSDINIVNHLRIALLLPTIELGAYWRPVVENLTRLSQKTILYTGHPWRGFNSQDPSNAAIEVVGEIKRITTNTEKTDYSGGFMSLSFGIVGRLLRYKPNVVIASGFSLWTLLALLLRPIGRWRVILAWEGSSPNVDFRHSKVRSFIRKAMAYFADALITNSQAGKDYLVNFLGIKEGKVTANPYMVPDAKTLLKHLENTTVKSVKTYLQEPVFLYVGRLEQRKGLQRLLEACAILNQSTTNKFTLLVVGDGPERENLEQFVADTGLSDRIKWMGWVNYESLGTYFHDADVFVFPTLEDTWGMVVLEAMAFSKPILCSQWAGAAEMVVDGKNGYIFDPHQPPELAELMSRFIDDVTLAAEMGQQSADLIAKYTPETAAQFFVDTALHVVSR